MGAEEGEKELTDSLQIILRSTSVFSMNDTGCKCFHYPSRSTSGIHLHFVIASSLITVCCTNYVQKVS